MQDGKRMLTPCSPGHPEAIEMTFNDLDADELLPPIVELKDLLMALENTRPTVSQDDIEKQVKWTQEFGSEGA
jgi:vacuolar protein-sorting-associated protein 4